MKKKISFFLQHNELQIILYALILIFTLSNGYWAYSLFLAFKEKVELINNEKNVPYNSIEGIIIVIADNKFLPKLMTNLNEWSIDLQHEMKNVDVIYVLDKHLELPKNLNDTLNKNIKKYLTQINVNQCKSYTASKLCKFTKSLKEILPKYQNLKWVLRIEPNNVVNANGLKKYIQILNKKFYMNPFLKAAVKKIGNRIVLDHRSGWFMSKQTAEDWSYLKMDFQNYKLEETPKGLPDALGIDKNDIADHHFVSSSFTSEDFVDSFHIMAKQCPQNFVYFGTTLRKTLKIEDGVTFNFEGDLTERTNAIRQFKKMQNKQIGVVMNENEGFLCNFNN